VNDVFREAAGLLGHDIGFQSATPKHQCEPSSCEARFVRTSDEKRSSFSYSAALSSARTSSISSFALLPSRRAMSS
jgi:hypothetical protein